MRRNIMTVMLRRRTERFAPPGADEGSLMLSLTARELWTLSITTIRYMRL